MKPQLLLLLILLNSSILFCQSIFDEINTPISKQTLLTNFDELITEIETHPGLYDYMSKKEWQNLKNSQLNKITDSCSAIDYYRITLKLVAQVGCVHSWLINNQFDLVDQKSMYLPYEVIIIDNKLYVTANLSKNKQIPIGSEITHINNKPSSEILDFLRAYIPADAYNQSYKSKMLAEGFTYFYHSLISFKDNNTLKYIHNSESNILLLNLSKLEFLKEEEQNSDQLQFEIIDTLKTAVMTIPTFAFYENIDDFKKFIDTSLNTYHKNHLEHLIIDLRGNQGGTPECSAHLLQYFYKEPFIYYTLDHGYYPHLTSQIVPFKNNPIEKPIILIDGFGISTTGHFCAMLKAKDLGIFVGEETGATYFNYANVKEIKFENIDFTLIIAQQKFEVDASKFQKNKGISPDYKISPSIEDIINDQDIVLTKALKLIK